MTREELPTVAPEEFRKTGERTEKAVWGVLLAAGQSNRYGEENKLLADLDGMPLIHHAATTLLESSLQGVTVVVGHECDRLREAVDDFSIEIRENPSYDLGQSTSVCEGVRAAQANGADGVLIALGDMPAVTVDSINLLIEAYEYGVSDVLAAACEGARGNPVLFDERFFDQLLAIDGDIGGRDLLTKNYGARTIETGDPGVLSDIDRPTDLDLIR